MKKLIPLFLFLSACATQAPTPAKKPAGPMNAIAALSEPRKVSYEARAQVQNKEEHKTYTVQMEALAVEPSMLRLDVSAGFGSPLGKLVLRGDQVSILLPQQKRAYAGTVSENSLRPILPIKLNPRDLMSFLFGSVPPNWKCEKKAEDNEVCTDPAGALNLQHDPRLEKKTAKWVVTGDKFAMTVLPTNIKTNVQIKPDLFSMPIPEGYSKHKLP